MPCPEGVRPRLPTSFQPMCGILSARGGREARYLSRQDGEARGVAFFASLEQHLQPDADSEKGLAARCLEHGFARPARRDLTHAVGQRTLPWDDDPFRAPLIVQDRLSPPPRLPGRHARAPWTPSAGCPCRNRPPRSSTLERPLGGRNSAVARGSGSAAMRSARANALNMVSHWWCALSPRRLSMCRVTCAWLTNPWKNSCIRSTSNSPIRRA